VIRPLDIQAQALFTAGCYRIKKANTFYIPAITAFSTVGYHNMVEGSLLGTAT
jgi:hypothetical protein